MKKTLQYAFLIVILNSCASIYGIHNPSKITETEIREKDKKINISQSIILDKNHVSKLNIKNQDTKSNLLQPLQFWVVKNDSIICNTVNCFTGGFPNLKWRINDVYNNRIIHTQDTEGIVALFHDYNLLPSKSDAQIALVFYAHFMGRQNKRFIMQVQNLLRENPELKVVYINNDNLF